MEASLYAARLRLRGGARGRPRRAAGVQVTGSRGMPRVEHLDGRLVCNAVGRVSSFRFSNELLNRIQEAAVWTFGSILQGFRQEAADRSERVGRLGDPILEDYMYNFDTA